MAPQSSILPGGQQSTGLGRVGQDLSNLVWTQVFM